MATEKEKYNKRAELSGIIKILVKKLSIAQKELNAMDKIEYVEDVHFSNAIMTMNQLSKTLKTTSLRILYSHMEKLSRQNPDFVEKILSNYE